MRKYEVDIAAVGAGPSNLALAIALEEMESGYLARETVLFEQHQDIRWHRNLLLPWAESQISFLKDLVTLRNPKSHYSFVNFLHSQGRLNEFINLGTFTPYRAEISEYLQWVAEELQQVRIRYNQRCESITPVRFPDGSVYRWQLTMTDGSVVTARDVVIGIGRDAYIPEELRALPRDRVIHSTEYLTKISTLSKDVSHRVVVIGGAQSAAEMFRSVRDDLPKCRPTIVMRSIGFTLYQISKFTNELFFPSFVDDFFEIEEDYRKQVLQEMRQTNYAGLASGLLEDLYRTQYLERRSGMIRSKIVTMTEILDSRIEGNEIVLNVVNRRTDQTYELRCDVVLLGTGFDSRQPALLRTLAESMGLSKLPVGRNYRLVTGSLDEAGLYLQGINEGTHGISDSLLSVLANRSSDIVTDIATRRQFPVIESQHTSLSDV